MKKQQRIFPEKFEEEEPEEEEEEEEDDDDDDTLVTNKSALRGGDGAATMTAKNAHRSMQDQLSTFKK